MEGSAHDLKRSAPRSVHRLVAAVVAGCVLTGCASSTLITSEPEGAKLYINEEPVGVTPYKHRDKKPVGSTIDVRLEMPGYDTKHASISRDEEVVVAAVIGAVFVLIPAIWIMGYKASHRYELTPLDAKPAVQAEAAPTTGHQEESPAAATQQGW